MNWPIPAPCWDTMAGRLLDAFFARINDHMRGFEGPLTVFGSAPIQLCLDGDFVSADADVMVLSHATELRQIAASVVQSTVGPGVMHGVQWPQLKRGRGNPAPRHSGAGANLQSLSEGG